MFGSHASKPRRLVLLAAVLVMGIGPLAACGDDDEPATSATTTAPEDVKAPMAEVVAKLPGIIADGDEASAAADKSDFDTASTKYEELHEVWEEVEGTIKDTDRDIYEEIETAQGLIKDGAENKNAARVKQGAEDQTTAIRSFMTANAP